MNCDWLGGLPGLGGGPVCFCEAFSLTDGWAEAACRRLIQVRQLQRKLRDCSTALYVQEHQGADRAGWRNVGLVNDWRLVAVRSDDHRITTSSKGDGDVGACLRVAGKGTDLRGHVRDVRAGRNDISIDSARSSKRRVDNAECNV